MGLAELFLTRTDRPEIANSGLFSLEGLFGPAAHSTLSSARWCRKIAKLDTAVPWERMPA